MTGEYRVVFDVSSKGAFHPILLLFTVFVIVLATYGSASLQKRTFQPWAARGIVGCAILFVVLLGLYTWMGRVRLIDDLREGRCQIVEGVVSDFSPMRPGGKGWESFEVNGVCFKYSDNVYSRGFHRTRTSGGPVRVGQKVRVAYRGNDIAKLEIASIE